MRSPDFLHKDAETTLCEHFIAAGSLCKFATNSQEILSAARETFLSAGLPTRKSDLSMCFWIDGTSRSQRPWPKPYVRGLDHLIFAGFGEDSSILANLRTRRIIGRFSPEIALDHTYFRSVIFPMLLTIVGATLGIAELHCACVARDQDALLFAGPSGAGKSTLALALSQNGYGFVSDDRTFCSAENDGVHVWGLPTQLKLRRQGLPWFPELQRSNLPHHQFGDRDVWLEPEYLTGVKRVRHARATSLIFLERENGIAFRLNPISSAEAENRLMPELMAELPDAEARRWETIRRITGLPCWLLQYGGPPEQIAKCISENFLSS